MTDKEFVISKMPDAFHITHQNPIWKEDKDGNVERDAEGNPMYSLEDKVHHTIKATYDKKKDDGSVITMVRCLFAVGNTEDEAWSLAKQYIENPLPLKEIEFRKP
jgi:uncharacterized protein YxjI